MSLPVDGTAEAPALAWGQMSRAARDAAYNNNAAVADSAAQIERRNATSAAYRAAHAAKLDIAYGPGERHAFDLYPAADPSAPCLVFIHGGYWQRGSRDVFAAYAAGAAALGLSVAMPSHSLAPEKSLTDIVAEIGMALDWLAAEGPGHGIAGPIVLSGWSAGAQLTAMHLGHPAVVAGLAISGVYELGPIRDTFLNAALNLSDEEIETLSPLRTPVVYKPLAIAFGTRELPALVEDARRFHRRRSGAHAPGPLISIAGAEHFSILDGLLNPDSPLLRTLRLLLPASAWARSPGSGGAAVDGRV